MTTADLFPVAELCKQHQIAVAFLHELSENGLVQIVTIAETEYISAERLSETERFIRLHNDLSINLEGLEAIAHLLHKVEHLQAQIRELHNRLRLYEDEPE